MGKLVKFDQRRRAIATRKPTAGDAQILMFTGVRYERSSLPGPTKWLDPSKPKRKRG